MGILTARLVEHLELVLYITVDCSCRLMVMDLLYKQQRGRTVSE